MLANMWYDTRKTPPPRRSLLETVFVLIYLRRAEAELMSNRAIIQALVAGAHPKAKTDPAIKAYQDYFDAMMPHLEKAATKHDEEKKALLEMTKSPIKIGLKHLYAAQNESWKAHTKKHRMSIPRAKMIQPRIPGTS